MLMEVYKMEEIAGIDSFESDEVKFSSGHYNRAKIMFFKGPSKERIELFEYI